MPSYRARPGPGPGLILIVAVLTAAGVLALGLLLDARGNEPRDLSSTESVRICTCVEGTAAEEIERLRAQVRLLRAEQRVNDAIDRKANRRSK